MRVSDFICDFRAEMRDDKGPNHLWSDQEIVGFLNQAVQEACERARLIEDRHTDGVCRIVLEPGQDTYALHPSVLDITRITLNGRLLDATSTEALDQHGAGWERLQGTPSMWILEGEQGRGRPQLRLVPTPTTAAEIKLTVYRGALRPLTLDEKDCEPDIPQTWHERLKPWLYRCAYLKHDSEMHNAAKAGDYEALFTNSFGERPDANVQRKRRDRRPKRVRMSSW